MTWKQLSAMKHAGRVVLLDGGLVTVLALGTQMNSTGGRGFHNLEYRTPWGTKKFCAVKGGHLTALQDVLGSGTEEET